MATPPRKCAGSAGGETPDDELKRLRDDNTQLRHERDVLKKSPAFFAAARS